jgi:fructosamine-3-kinase
VVKGERREGAAEEHTYDGHPEASRKIEVGSGLAVTHQLDHQAQFGVKMRLEEADLSETCNSRERDGQVSAHGPENVRYRVGLVPKKDCGLGAASGLMVVVGVVVDCRAFEETRALEDG